MTEAVPKVRTRRRWRWLGEAALVLLVVFAVHHYQTRNTAAGPAPPLAGVDLAGAPIELAALRGQPVLVHFWATWCPVCRLEQSSIDAIARDWAVVTVALEDTSAEDLQSFMSKEGLNFRVLRDPDGRLAASYGVRGVPTSFVVDPHGEIRYTTVGYTTGPGLRFRLWLAGRQRPDSGPQHP